MRSIKRSWLAALGSLVLAAVLGGCSRFESDWRSPALLRPPAGDAFQGRWKGSWKSRQGGHTGSLRCIVTPVGDDTYSARFHATYFLLLQFEYTAQMKVERHDNAARFTGEADLGKMAGGVYRYDGQADGVALHCDYRAASDHGYFKMARPKQRTPE